MSARHVAARVARICAEIGPTLPASHAAEIDAIRQRINGPLRVALAGRVKAGKSTLLNALIGERLAPTDAGECTRVVTWYRYDTSYAVTARTTAGTTIKPRFRKLRDALAIDLPPELTIRSLEVGWPSRSLNDTIFIDTPGLGSLTAGLEEGTGGLLEVTGPNPNQADAMIYLMRHAHGEDLTFLEGLRDAGVPLGSPVNTVGILSRADEIGGGRPDALDSCQRIAVRYQNDERIRSLSATVIPMVGLLAETAATLEESEFVHLARIAADEDAHDTLLLSVDRFRDPEANPLPAELRERVLQRFGLYGIRLGVRAISDGTAPTSQALAAFLLRASGMHRLREVIRQYFTTRARVLVARSALTEMRSLASRLAAEDRSSAARLSSAVDQVLSSANELALLEVLHEAAVGIVAFGAEERMEAERIAGDLDIAERIALPVDAPASVRDRTILAGVERWRTRAANPLLDRATARACEVMARAYEGMYAEVTGSPS